LPRRERLNMCYPFEGWMVRFQLVSWRLRPLFYGGLGHTARGGTPLVTQPLRLRCVIAVIGRFTFHLGHDNVVYQAVSGRVRLHDPRRRRGERDPSGDDNVVRSGLGQ
jgi:hypothetical protein